VDEEKRTLLEDKTGTDDDPSTSSDLGLSRSHPLA